MLSGESISFQFCKQKLSNVKHFFTNSEQQMQTWETFKTKKKNKTSWQWKFHIMHQLPIDFNYRMALSSERVKERVACVCILMRFVIV